MSVSNNLPSFFTPTLKSFFPPQSKVNQAFIDLKSNLELSESLGNSVTQKHNAVREAVENKLYPLKTQLIGSLQRQTAIIPKKDCPLDIDILVVLGSFYSWTTPDRGISPQDAMVKLNSAVRQVEKYDALNPQKDQPVIVFEYKDGIKVELVPAYLDQIGYSSEGKLHTPVGRGYWVAKNGKWELADYDHEADYISKQNRLTGGLLIPTIKMLKAIKRNHFPIMKSFHLEVIANLILPLSISLKRSLGKPIFYPQIISEFFTYASLYLANPVKIPGSNSPEVKLEPFEAFSLFKPFKDLKEICTSIPLASESDQLKYWRMVFGEVFPGE